MASAGLAGSGDTTTSVEECLKKLGRMNHLTVTKVSVHTSDHNASLIESSGLPPRLPCSAISASKRQLKGLEEDPSEKRCMGGFPPSTDWTRYPYARQLLDMVKLAEVEAAGRRTKTHKPASDNSSSVGPASSEAIQRDFDPTQFMEISLIEKMQDGHERAKCQKSRKEVHQTTLGPAPKANFYRQYGCPHCPKSFGWSNVLKRHILTHTGERPFQCSLCPEKFTRNFILQNHMKTHHVERPAPADCTGLVNTKIAGLQLQKEIEM